jgi:hypothetical protein
MTLSRTYVLWCPMTLSSVWLGNKYECRNKLIPAQFRKVIWILAMNFRTPQWKLRTWLPISSSLFIHYSDSPFNIRASSPGLGYILIDVGQKLELGQTPIHSGRTNNKPQFHLGRTECPVVSSPRRTSSQMGRTMSVTDQYVKVCFLCCNKNSWVKLHKA